MMKRIFCGSGFIAGIAAASIFAGCGMKNDPLRLDINNYTEKTLNVNGTVFTVRAYENVSYAANPADPAREVMNIYVPVEYYDGGSVDGWTRETAPVFFPNQIGGYMPANPGTVQETNGGFTPGTPADSTWKKPSADGRGMPGGKPGDNSGEKAGMMPDMKNGGLHGNPPSGPGPMGKTGSGPDGKDAPEQGTPSGSAQGMPGGDFRMHDGPDSIAEALSRGYVAASAGARGRTEKYGHAPACIVDLKAAVRYLRHNKKLIPGDMEKIISNGTSAGGALSALLGASGNSHDYDKYLKEIGAADERDDIFAVSAYCPITNLENADGAYEWFFNGQNSYEKMDISMIDYHMERKLVKGSLTEDEKKLSDELKKQFPSYLNSLNLKDESGNVLSLDENGHGSFEDYIKKLVLQSAQKALDEGVDFSGKNWMKIENGKVTDLDFEAYKKYLGRQKLPGAFDSLKNDTGENNLFGDDTDTFKHFTEFAFNNSSVSGKLCDSELVKIMNAMNYVQNKEAKTSENWRIRAGTKDSDTAPCISAILALSLENSGKNVDYCLPWDIPHSGDYDLKGLFDWIETISR